MGPPEVGSGGLLRAELIQFDRLLVFFMAEV
jgi:hypothetical protein